MCILYFRVRDCTHVILFLFPSDSGVKQTIVNVLFSKNACLIPPLIAIWLNY